MRAFPGTSLALSVAIHTFLSPAAAFADDYFLMNQNQTGIALPGVMLPNGYDEVRAADGTTCRSSVGGSGAFLDSGVIGGGLRGEDTNSLTAYGRVVMPLGEKSQRVNCDHLYRLELERLQLEVQMLKRGLDPRLNQSEPDAEWASDEGWSADGRGSDGEDHPEGEGNEIRSHRGGAEAYLSDEEVVGDLRP